MKIPCLNKRLQFTNVARFGKKFVSNAFIVQAIETNESQDLGVGRFGFIVTKKNGNAVVRNLIKRRLKSIVQNNLKMKQVPVLDYVVIARVGCVDIKYHDLEKNFESAFAFFREKFPNMATFHKKGN